MIPSQRHMILQQNRQFDRLEGKVFDSAAEKGFLANLNFLQISTSQLHAVLKRMSVYTVTSSPKIYQK